MVFVVNMSSLFASDQVVKNNIEEEYKDTLVAGLVELPPFCFYNEQNQLQGYAIDLLDTIAKRLGYPIKYVLSADDDATPITDKKWSIRPDIIFVSSCWQSPDSSAFSKGVVCFQTIQALMVKRWAGLDKISDLFRKRVVSYDPEWTLDRFQSMGVFPKLPMIHPDSILTMNQLLFTAGVDASVADIQVQKYLLNNNQSMASSVKIIALDFLPTSYRLMINDHSKKINYHQFQNLMFTLNRDKTTLQLQNKWFDFSRSGERMTFNRLLSISLGVLVALLLALFFIYLGLMGESIKRRRYYNLIMKTLNAFPYDVNLYEIDKEGKLKESIYSNFSIHKKIAKLNASDEASNYSIEEFFEEFDNPQSSKNNALLGDRNIRCINERYYKKASFLIDLKSKQLKMDIYSDVTEIIQSKMKSDLAKRLKSSLLANMSHDIRTPLNTIVGFSQLLTETQSRDELVNYSKIITDSTYYLVDLIDDIVQLSHYKNSSVKFNEQDINLIEYENYFSMLVNQSLSKFGKEDKINIVYQDYNQNITLRVDWQKYMRVAMNMISNSIKFTEKGSIEIGFFVEDGEIYFYVEDSGIGIDPNRIPIIFNAYESIDSISETKGTGLGMAICIAIMKRMGGTVGVYSKLNEGSLFWCSFKPSKLEIKNSIDKESNALRIVKDKIKNSYKVN